MSKIILCGASSVGKTTLSADWCSMHQEYTQITEVARDVMKERSISREDLLKSRDTPEKELYLELQRLILEEQNKWETELEESLFISDRGPDPIVYAQLENKELASEMSKSEAAIQCFARYRQSLVVIVCPLGTTTDDGFRMVQWREEQEQFTSRLRELLSNLKIPYFYLGERDRQLRIEVLRKAVHGEVPVPVRCFISNPCLSFYLSKETAQRNRLCEEETVQMIRTILINPSEIQLRYIPMEDSSSCRVMAAYGEDYFICVKFHWKLTSSLIRELLTKGVQVNGDMYQFLGCSPGGVTTRQCYMLKGSVEDVEKLFTQFGEFSNIRIISEQLRGISQLFVTGRDSGVEVCSEKIRQVEESVGAIISHDGCGGVGLKLAGEIAEGANAKVSSPEDGIPSVLQVMFLGYTCVVSKEPRVDSDTIHVRKSTEKFEAGTRAFQTFWVCAHSRPNSYGHLSKEHIMLLSCLGVRSEVFLKRQEQYHGHLENMLRDRESALLMLDWKDQSEIATLCESPQDMELDRVQLSLKRVRNELILNMEKLSVPLLDSRMLFGVCDPLDVLKDGECFIRISHNGTSETVKAGTQVVVGKRLCYSLGDFRVLTAVEHECLNYLIDCLVVKRPHAAEMGGSDLAGDQYFVCWDGDLIPTRTVAPKNYHFPGEPLDHDVTREMLIEFFSEQENLVAQIRGYFQIWADLKEPGCNECEKLAALLSLSTNSLDKVKIPHEYLPPRGPLKTRPDRLWNRMQLTAMECRRVLIAEVIEDAIASSQSVQAISEAFIRTLLGDENRAVPEYTLFTLICKWCSVQDLQEGEKVGMLREFSDSINFSMFTLVERREAVQLGIPVERVMNALYKSRLLTRDMLLPLYLTSPTYGWKLYFKASSSDFNWNYLLSALTEFPESLLVLQLQHDVKLVLNDVKLAFHFIGPLKEEKSGIIPIGYLSTCIYSPQLGSTLRHVTQCEYNLKLTEDVIQVFQNLEICDTFIYMRKLFVDRKEGTQKHNIISIDLNRFKGGIPRDYANINKCSFYSAEVFVKIPSWTIEHISTNSILPHEVLEDVPGEEETAKEIEILDTDPIRVLAPDAALKDLKEFAKNGDCLQFSRIISIQNDEVLQLIPRHKILDEVLALLSNFVIKNSHIKPTEDTIGCLMNILQSPLIQFQTPKDLLFLYSSLQKLHLNQAILLHIDQGLRNINLDTVAQYFEIISHWEWWTFLPLSISYQLLDKLYLKHSMLLSKTSKQPDTDDSPMPNTIQDLVRSCEKPPTPIDETQLDLYKCYFAYLLLTHFLAKSPSAGEYGESVDTECSVCGLRAMCSQDSPVGPEVESIEDKEEGESIKKEKPELLQVTFFRTEKFFSSRFVSGAYVKIRLLPTPRSEHSNDPIALGRIVNVCSADENQITVDIHEPVPDCVKRSAQSSIGCWGLTIVGNVTSFKRSIRALQQLPSSPISPVLLAPDAFPPVLPNEELNAEFTTALLDEVIDNRSEMIVDNPPIKKDHCSACKDRIHFNRSQEDAIAAALSQRLTLIHGYPGSGKTVVASEIVHRMCHLYEQNEDYKCKILVTAATDKTVDILTRQLLALNLFVIRVGNLSLVSPDIHEHTLDLQLLTKRVQVQHRIEQFEPYRLKQEILNSADVIATTCVDAGSRELKEIEFTFTLIDDATLVIEPVSLIPIVKSCQRLVLIGDPKQLAPTLPIGTSLQPTSKDIPSFDALRVTLFHRLYKHARPLFLEEQHRMHPHIAQFPARVFYSGKMGNGVTVDERKRPSPVFKFIYTHKPVVFIHVESTEIGSGVSISNPTEADGVVEVLKALMSLGILSLNDITVLTPYAGQVQCIKERLASALINVDVCSIEDFQGRERNVVVFSTVRSNTNAELGLTGDPHIINLLLTRAQLILIGIGDGETLCSSPLWDEWLKRYDVLNENEFCKLTEEMLSNNYETSNRSKRQYPRRDSCSSSASCRESEVGSEMSWYSDSEPASDNYSVGRITPPRGTQGRTYPRLSEMPTSTSEYANDASTERDDGDY